MSWIVLVLGISVTFVLGADVHLIVQPTGSDSNDGISHPVKTLEKAVSRLDDADVRGKRVYIELRKGYYDLSRTITIHKNHGHPVTIRSFYNQEQAHVTGGKRLDAHKFHPVTDSHILQRLPSAAHSKVRQLRFSDVGISKAQLGKMQQYGFYRSRTSGMEISYNGKPLRLARWPNKGYVNVVSVPDGKEGMRFGYPSTAASRAEKWTHESEMWVYGYWYWSWADDTSNVVRVDTSHRTMTIGTKMHYGIRTGYYQLGSHAGYDKQGGYFRVFNALSELDEPGEYYIDRTSGILYIWPPEHNGAVSPNDIIYGSMISTLFDLSGLSNFAIQDLILESSRHYGINGNKLTNCHFEKLEIRNTATYPIHVKGANITVRQCDIHDTDGGISISGGDRIHLTPSGHLVENNRIQHFSRATGVGMHAIACGGVGTLIQYNELGHGHYTAIMWNGNDHMIRRNHIHHMCVEATDCGAVHSGRDWTFRGNVIKENHIHHVLRLVPGGEVRGVMLDDSYSSVLIENNVFYENEVHFNIGGGRDTIGRYNVFYNAHAVSVDVDGRGIHGYSNTKTLNDKLKAVPYQTGIWAQRYPKLAHINDGNSGEPAGNQIYKNVIYRGSRPRDINYHGAFLETPKYFNLHDNYHAHTNEFNDLAHGDYRLVCGARSWAGHEHVPQPPTLAEVGPHVPYGPSYRHPKIEIKKNGRISIALLSGAAPLRQLAEHERQNLKTLEKAISRLNDADVKGNRVYIELRKGYYDLKRIINLNKDYRFPVTITIYVLESRTSSYRIYQLGARAGYSQQGGDFHVFNALSELDEPGEYYIDRTSGILYIWPPEHNGAVSPNDHKRQIRHSYIMRSP